MTTAVDYDLSGIDRIHGIPSVGAVITFQRQVAKVQTSYKCECPNAGDHGWSWIMCTWQQWLLKRGNTAAVVPPTKPAPYAGNTNGLKFIYKQQLKLYEEYEEHKRNTIKAITVCFDEDLLIDLETDGELIGYTPM